MNRLDTHRWDLAGDLSGLCGTHVADWTDGEIFIPRAASPRRRRYDRAHLALVKRSFHGNLSPLAVDARDLTMTNKAVNRERYAMYRRMLKAGESVPPIVVERIGGYLYVVDGNHRTQAALDSKRYELSAMLLRREPLMARLRRPGDKR